jgi:proteasome accessory factor A
VGERLFGLETEYAAVAVSARGERVEQHLLLDALMQRARERLPHLDDDHANGMYLQNGARFYLDAGGHPEMTTPECTTPDDVVRFVRAGERILLGLAGPRPLVPGARCSFYRSNVDYSGSQATWGCHESYLHHTDPRSLPGQMVPHLVSRVIFTGAGGFDNLSPGVRFTLSPRAHHVHQTVSEDSTQRRGIFHAKNEALCSGGRHRLHVTFGESLGSDLALWLKVGTTALVVALCDAGLRPGDAVALRTPVASAHAIALDPSCRATVDTTSGRRTAIAIQRHYLEQVETHARTAGLPAWSAVVCARWRALLDRLEQGWEAVATTLDWAIKLMLFREHARRRCISWDALAGWSSVEESVAGTRGRVALGSRSLGTTLRRRLGLGEPEEVERFLAVRPELFELDARVGELGEAGLFASLDGAGVLGHRVEGIRDVEQATEQPPAVGRALVRGRLVRELAGAQGRYTCDWEHVWDGEEDRWIDLGDPFATDGTWREPSIEDTAPLAVRLRAEQLRRPGPPRDPDDPVVLSERARQLRMRGALGEAERIFRRAIEIEDARVAPDSPKRAHRRNHLAMVLLRAGRLDEAAEWNAAAWALKAGRHDLVSGRILFVRIALLLLRGERDVSLPLGQLKTVLSMEPLACLADVARVWTIPDVLDSLGDRLSDDDMQLMLHAFEALNDRAHLPVLEALRPWRDAEPVGLAVPWPACS